MLEGGRVAKEADDRGKKKKRIYLDKNERALLFAFLR